MIRVVVLFIAAAGIGCATLEPADEPVASADGVSQELTAVGRPTTLVLPGDNFFPESITASLGGALYVSVRLRSVAAREAAAARSGADPEPMG